MISSYLKKPIEIVSPNIGILSVLGYIFFSVIPHASAPRYIFAGLMLVAALYQLYKGQLQRPSLDMITVSLFALSAIVIVSATLSPYRADSFSTLHKEILPFLLGFLLLTCQKLSSFDRQKCSRHVYLALIAGFVVKMLLAIWAGINNDWVFSIYETADIKLPRYLDFFAADIIYYLPFLLTPLFFWPIKPGYRLLLGLVTLLTLVLAFVSGVRTTFIFVCAIISFFLLIRFWRRKWYLLALVMVSVSIAYLAKNHVTNPTIGRYYSIVSPDTYKFGSDGSVSERQAIAKGVWEVSRDRVWLGYGPGWKKLPTVAAENGYVDRWKNGSEPWHQWAVTYFSYGEGRVNPHNFYLMLLFEVGALGLGVYLAFMIAIVIRALRSGLKPNSSAADLGLSVCALTYVGVYLGAGVAGGPWLPITLLVAASAVSLVFVQPSRIG